jgi:hypothetical protein
LEAKRRPREPILISIRFDETHNNIPISCALPWFRGQRNSRTGRDLELGEIAAGCAAESNRRRSAVACRHRTLALQILIKVSLRSQPDSRRISVFEVLLPSLLRATIDGKEGIV